MNMRKRQFTIRALLIATFLVAVSLPFCISRYDDAMKFLFPPPKPGAVTQLTAAQVIPMLMQRVPPSSAKEIMIRPMLD